MKKQIAKPLIQILFLLLFLVLFVMHEWKAWLLVFLIGILISFYFGRIYCGWICPIHTITMFVTKAKKRANRKDHPLPSALAKPWIRIASALLFVSLVVVGERSGHRIPVMMMSLLLAVFLTLYYSEAFWHRYLCPYGAILKVTSSRAKHHMEIDFDTCKGNNTCVRVCPTLAIAPVDGQNQIDKSECLVCLRCKMNCKEKAIGYR